MSKTAAQIHARLRRQADTIEKRKAELAALYEARADLWAEGISQGVTQEDLARSSGVKGPLVTRTLKQRDAA